MPRAILIHWKPEEAGPRVAALKDLGWDVTLSTPAGSADLKALAAHPPDVFVIDLTRLPSQGRAVAVELRRRASTRRVPILFAGGEPEKIAAARRLLPDALFAGWDGIVAALAEARPLAAPAVPDTMAGYSGTPLVKKLGVKPGSAVALIGAPDGFELPEATPARREAQRVLLFVRSQAELARRFDSAASAMAAGGGLWIVWPKKTSGIASDLSETAVRAFGLARGWVDYKVCAVDATWSGLLFARRR